MHEKITSIGDFIDLVFGIVLLVITSGGMILPVLTGSSVLPEAFTRFESNSDIFIYSFVFIAALFPGIYKIHRALIHVFTASWKQRTGYTVMLNLTRVTGSCLFISLAVGI